MATATKPPGTIAVRPRQQQSCIDEMRASARMRARLMKKIPKALEFPRGLVEVTTPGASHGPSLGTSLGTSPGPGQIVGAATAPRHGHAHDADALEESSLPPADNPCGLTHSTK
jgi:hypothetical protein